MPSPVVTALLIAAGVAALIVSSFLVYVYFRYGPIVGRIFVESPVFKPPQAEPLEGGEEVRFPTIDGLTLAGTYLKTRTPTRAGVVVFCPEFLGDRGSAALYVDFLRDIGFDIFAFDFRNHGDSDCEPDYKPLQWVSDRELRDLRAAVAYVRTRPDADPAGVGLFGVSRGGSAAICVAARDHRVWGLVTDGAFGTRSTMLAYIYRWAEIYVASQSLWRRMPRCMFEYVGWAGRVQTQKRLGRRFPHVERAVSRLTPRPLLMIHGEKDNYIKPEIARVLFDLAGDPKDFWVVRKAKHNRCREVDPRGYRERVEGFFRRFAPRRPSASSAPDDQEVAMARVRTD